MEYELLLQESFCHKMRQVYNGIDLRLSEDKIDIYDHSSKTEVHAQLLTWLKERQRDTSTWKAPIVLCSYMLSVDCELKKVIKDNATSGWHSSTQ